MKIRVWLRGSLSQEDPPWARGCGTHLVLQVPCLQVVQKNCLESKGVREPGLVLSVGWGSVVENVWPAPRTYRESGDKRHHVELG